jgi:hypothetical protein
MDPGPTCSLSPLTTTSSSTSSSTPSPSGPELPSPILRNLNSRRSKGVEAESSV